MNLVGVEPRLSDLERRVDELEDGGGGGGGDSLWEMKMIEDVNYLAPTETTWHVYAEGMTTPELKTTNRDGEVKRELNADPLSSALQVPCLGDCDTSDFVLSDHKIKLAERYVPVTSGSSSIENQGHITLQTQSETMSDKVFMGNGQMELSITKTEEGQQSAIVFITMRTDQINIQGSKSDREDSVRIYLQNSDESSIVLQASRICFYFPGDDAEITGFAKDHEHPEEWTPQQLIDAEMVWRTFKSKLFWDIEGTDPDRTIYLPIDSGISTLILPEKTIGGIIETEQLKLSGEKTVNEFAPFDSGNPSIVSSWTDTQLIDASVVREMFAVFAEANKLNNPFE
jgi:hypothetical protein